MCIINCTNLNVICNKFTYCYVSNNNHYRLIAIFNTGCYFSFKERIRIETYKLYLFTILPA